MAASTPTAASDPTGAPAGAAAPARPERTGPPGAAGSATGPSGGRGPAARGLVLGVLLLVLGGCRPATKEAADREVYGILAARRARVPQAAGSLDVDGGEARARAARGAPRGRLDLRGALALAAAASRELREERDRVYLAALTLTERRRALETLPGAGGAAGLSFDAEGNEGSAAGEARLTRALRTGGSVALRLATDFLRGLTGDPLRVAQSILEADLVLPLLRGSGRLVALEEWRQAERDVVYALRRYARFQQEFTVAVAEAYLRALEAEEIWRNEEAAYASLSQLVLEQAEKAQAGRIPEFLVDQARQDLLRSDDRRQRERAAYERALDQLKLDLGVPVDQPLEPDPGVLAALGSADEGPAPAAAVATALGARLDLRNARDQEEDARRKVAVARDALRARVDLTLGAELTTPGEAPLDFGRAAPTGGVGLDVDLPLERTAERNAWRAAQLAATQAARARQRLEDQVALEVREAARRLDQAARSRQIQTEGVRLAERRVESTALFLEQGDATIRDRLEAEDARRQARNALTTARVDHFLARLRLASDLGTLRVDGAGGWTLLPEPPPPPQNGGFPEPVK